MSTMIRGSFRDVLGKSAGLRLRRVGATRTPQSKPETRRRTIRRTNPRRPRFSVRAAFATLVLHVVALFPMALPAPVDDDWCPDSAYA